MSQNIKIELNPRTDKNDSIIFMGRTKAPMVLKFKKGVIFFIFLSEDGSEELQIGLARPDSDFSSLRKRISLDGSLDRIIVPLVSKEDDHGKIYYMSLIQDEVELDLSDGYLFFVFNSIQGKEEMHIVKNKEMKEKKEPEIYRIANH